MISATTINEVITHLDYIINYCREKQNRIGYFACLYRKMTIAVKDGIANNSFDDGKRMELLDVIFANRYLQAWEAYISNQPCSSAWCVAFDTAQRNNLIVLQHLLLGINTHINLDLAIAAAETCEAERLHELEPDFNRINNVIANMTMKVQEDLSEVWPPLRFVTKIANQRYEPVLNFSITKARQASWANATALSLIAKNERKGYINVMDKAVVELGKRISNPGLLINLMLQPILKKENKKVSEIINLLYN